MNVPKRVVQNTRCLKVCEYTVLAERICEQDQYCSCKHKIHTWQHALASELKCTHASQLADVTTKVILYQTTSIVRRIFEQLTFQSTPKNYLAANYILGQEFNWKNCWCHLCIFRYVWSSMLEISLLNFSLNHRQWLGVYFLCISKLLALLSCECFKWTFLAYSADNSLLLPVWCT